MTCGDTTGEYNSCYWANSCDGVVDAAWHDCYFYNQGCDAWNGCSTYACEGEESVDPDQGGESAGSFFEWLECNKNSSGDCERLDESGAYYQCYMNEACDGVVDAAWHDCYWYNRGCEAWNGCETYACEKGPDGTVTNDISFLDWLDCYKNTSGDAETCGDTTGDYNSCYWAGSCDGIVDAAWHDCYFYNQGCQAWNECETYTCEEGSDGTITNTVDFYEWLDCYKNTSGTPIECGD